MTKRIPSARDRILTFLSDGAVPEIAPWVGTTVGSAVISGAKENVWQVAIGAAIVALGLTPLWLRSWALRQGQREDDMLDARERLVGEAAARVLSDAADFEAMPRAGRVGLVQERVDELLDEMGTSMFEGFPGVRIVLYDISADKTKLSATAIRGRNDAPRGFDASDVRGEIAIDRLSDVEDHFFCPDTSQLPEAWGTAGRPYATFISLPIRSSDEAYGMLTLDSPNIGDLTLRDAEMMETLASAFAFYRAAQARGKHKTVSIAPEKEEQND
ncbi:GAF domain-containing protein [Leifsonia sp. Root4]|uniref:GAF domain-containing protein n=1 Tax=Leifsonia sp. Root4 TaxID=1736525 RepID=UPI0012F9CC78|nr:GAF domain-containing protein [Leifsonia sp. Root4]